MTSWGCLHGPLPRGQDPPSFAETVTLPRERFLGSRRLAGDPTLRLFPFTLSMCGVLKRCRDGLWRQTEKCSEKKYTPTMFISLPHYPEIATVVWSTHAVRVQLLRYKHSCMLKNVADFEMDIVFVLIGWKSTLVVQVSSTSYEFWSALTITVLGCVGRLKSSVKTDSGIAVECGRFHFVARGLRPPLTSIAMKFRRNSTLLVSKCPNKC